jgi:murein DD-endopeptidase MepM/ murein hydrolase activator NlpD
MEQFRQKPSNFRKKKSIFPEKIRLFQRTRSDSGKISNGKICSSRTDRVRKDKVRESRGSGFSIPITPLGALASIAITAFIAFAVINWEDVDLGVPNVSSFEINENPEVEERTLRYAATGVSSVLPVVEIPENGAIESPAAAVIADDDNPHGMLITFEWQQYRVLRGDSVSGIAQRFGVSVGAIIASNNITNARRLQEGAVLRIPNIDGIPYQIRRGDSLSRISASFNVPLEIILDVNDLQSETIRMGDTIFIPGARMNDIDLRMSLGELFMYPLATRQVTSPFGMRRDPISRAMQFHNGVDFRANIGTTVVASLDGVVSNTGENRLYGKYIIISHSNGYKTFYAHLNVISVREGDRVARGRKIGESGNTGYSTGPHLHFGIFDRNNRWVNPLELLN